MRIVILGWGSLIWRPGGLPHDGRWRSGGPSLPIEFSRISPDGRLTLVIDPEAGADVVTRWTLSSRAALDAAREDLSVREGCNAAGVGHLDLRTGRGSRDAFPAQREVRAQIEGWGRSVDADAILWTALPATFEERTGRRLSPVNALDYLDSLSGDLRETALTYLRNAPPEVETPVRRAFDADPRFSRDRR